jgi:putative ABC transport system substrate-binding protein
LRVLQVLGGGAFPVQRRKFITLLGGAAASSGMAWSLGARAQQLPDRPRIAFLASLPADDVEGHARLTAFREGLEELGWRVGRNLDMDYRAAGRNTERLREFAHEMAASRPHVLVAAGAPALAALSQATRFLPIIFANATTDQGNTGYMARLARPARNASGFMNSESRFGWKWLELLRQIEPRITRVGVLRSDTTTGIGQMSAIQSVAPSYGVELTTLGDHDMREIERGIATFVRGPNHGLIVTSQLPQAERDLIIALAAQYRLPAVYGFRRYVEEGGLISYGTDQIEPYRKAAGYVDRILMGEKVFNLPVQAPLTYKTVLNTKTAKMLDIEIPERVLARTDEMLDASAHND